MTTATATHGLSQKELDFCESAGINPASFAANRAQRGNAMTVAQVEEQAATLAAGAIDGMTGQTALNLMRQGINPHVKQPKQLDFVRCQADEAAHNAAIHRQLHPNQNQPAGVSQTVREAVNAFLRTHPTDVGCNSYQLTVDEKDFCSVNSITPDQYRELRTEYRRAHWRPPHMAA